MISDYIDPKFCNIVSIQLTLGDFSKAIAVFIYKSRNRKTVRKKIKIKDTSIQTTLDDFGLKTVNRVSITNFSEDLKIKTNFICVNLDYWFFDDVDDFVVSDMGVAKVKNDKLINKYNKTLYGSSVDSVKTNVHVLGDGSFEMVNPRCTHCGSYDVVKKDFVESNPKVEYHGHMNLRLKRYYCKNCHRKFQTRIESVKDDGERFSKSFREKIRESYANRGGSLDQIAKDAEIFLNVNLSHQEVKNILQFDFEHVEYYEELVENRKKTDDGDDFNTVEDCELFMVRKKNHDIMGYLVVDELFIHIKEERWYCVSFHDISNQDVPFAVGLVKTRSLENMTRLYELATQDTDIISLTTDHFSIYEAIADKKGIVHQECIVHHFSNLNDDIYSVLKDKEISDIERMSLAHQTTKYRNIFRTYDEKESLMLWESFLDDKRTLHDVFAKNAESISEHFLRHTQFTRNNFIPRTTNQAEKFHSLPGVMQLKNSTKSPKGFLEYMAVIMQYHEPKSRKQKRP